MNLTTALCGAVLATGALPTRDAPIIRRHDQPDSLYIALGRGYPAIAHINLPTPKGAADGEGTLIALPAFLQGVEGPVLVGVSSGQSSRATGGQRGRYGVVEYYVRVSRYVAWIESITGPLSF